MSRESFVAAEDVKLNRVGLAEVSLIHDVGQVLHRDRFPGVHAYKNVALPDALAAGRSFATDGDHFQAAAKLLALTSELVGGDGSHAHPERVPGAIDNGFPPLGRRGQGQV
jgi:hypothetical protein